MSSREPSADVDEGLRGILDALLARSMAVEPREERQIEVAPHEPNDGAASIRLFSSDARPRSLALEPIAVEYKPIERE